MSLDTLVSNNDTTNIKKIVPQSIFFFNDTATTEIYTLSLHDALPISRSRAKARKSSGSSRRPSLEAKVLRRMRARPSSDWQRSEEHTSELQSHSDLVCRLLLEKIELS